MRQPKPLPDASKDLGVPVQIFGKSKDNARAFWNWQFLDDVPELPKTRAMLMKTCDVRLPARLGRKDLDYIVDALVASASGARNPGTKVA